MTNIRASSLSELFDCPARWEAKYIEGLTLPTSEEALLGKAVHAAANLYDSHVLKGIPITVDDGKEAILTTIYMPDEEVAWDKSTAKEVEKRSIQLYELYVNEIQPLYTYVFVEKTCEPIHFKDLGIGFTGTPDRVFRSENGYGVLDIKTGKNVVSKSGNICTSKFAPQIGVYELAVELSFKIKIDVPAVIAGLNAAKTPDAQRAGVGHIYGAKELVLGEHGEKGLLHYAAHYINNGLFHGNPKSMLCLKKFCPIFHKCKWRR